MVTPSPPTNPGLGDDRREPRDDSGDSVPIVTSPVGIAVLAEFEAQIGVVSEKVLDDAIAAGLTDGSAEHRPDAALHGLALCWGALQYARDGRAPDFSWFVHSVEKRFQSGRSREDSIGVIRVGGRSMHRILCDMAMAHPHPEQAIAELTQAIYSLSHLAVLALTEALSEVEADLATTARRARTEHAHALLSGAVPPSSTAAQRNMLASAPASANYLIIVGSGPQDPSAAASYDMFAAGAAIEAALEADFACCVQRGEHLVAVGLLDGLEPKNLDERIKSVAKQSGARLSVGRPSNETGSVPGSYAEATLAQRHCQNDGSVVRYETISLLQHVARAATEAGLVPIPVWMAGDDSDDLDELLMTVRSLLDNNRVVAKTAAALAVHPNTIYGRLRRFEEVTSLDPRSFSDQLQIALVLELNRQADWLSREL